jgi:hypothetical protein
MTEASTQKYKIFVVKNLAAYQFETNATNYANLAKVHYFTRVFSYGFQDFFRDLNYYADGTNAKTMVKEFITDLKLDDITIPLDERLKKMDIYLKPILN